MIDFCSPDPKHPGFWICPEDHGTEPHRKVDPNKYPEVMRQLAEVWDEGYVAGWGAGHVADKSFNPYRNYLNQQMFTQDEK